VRVDCVLIYESRLCRSGESIDCVFSNALIW